MSEQKKDDITFKGTISIIVAFDENYAIGRDNKLLWHLPNDLKFFKNTTSGHTIIMGRKTFESIGKALPNRRNIVISNNKDLNIEGVEVFNSLKEAINNCHNEKEIFIIGGAQIYKQSLPFVEKLYITQVKHQFNADAYFTKINENEWNLTFKENHYKDEKHKYDYSFLILDKQQNNL